MHFCHQWDVDNVMLAERALSDIFVSRQWETEFILLVDAEIIPIFTVFQEFPVY